MITVLVTGGRHYNDWGHVSTTLDVILSRTGRVHVVQGGAAGADALAKRWAWRHRMPSTTYVARWDRHGLAAGGIRNQQMLDQEWPRFVLAFPGGSGTKDMKERAQRAEVPVIDAMGDLHAQLKEIGL